MKKWIEHGVLIVLLLPLLFINIKSSHDWGDDFAQYIHQAQNLLNAIPQDETGYVFNENNFIGPQAYPVGFPIILSVVMAFKGIDISAFNVLISCFWIFSCLLGYLILRHYVSFLTALFTTLIIAYNPFLLTFKAEVLSDLPYMFFSMWAIYLLHKKENLLNAILLGLLIGFTIHVRTIGVVVLLSFILVKYFNKKNQIFKYVNTLVSLSITLVVFLAIKFLFPYHANYPLSLNPVDFWFNANNQASYNFDKLYYIFKGFDNENFYYVGVIASSCLIAFSIFGFFHFAKEHKHHPIIYYMLGYVFVIMFFQYGNAGLRFLIPILFFVFLFSIYGIKKNINQFNFKTPILASSLGLIVLFSYHTAVSNIISKQGAVVDGPYTLESQELFGFIKANISEKEIISCYKPRAIALYTGKKAVSLSPDASYTGIRKEVKKFGVNYILVSPWENTSTEEYFLSGDTTVCKEVFKNSKFKLYKIIKTDF